MAIFTTGYVTDVNDPTGAGRVRVKVADLDKYVKDDNNLPWAFPLIPRMVHIRPKNGELVNIYSPDNNGSIRFYSGPIISQPQYIERQGHITPMLALTASDKGDSLSPPMYDYPDSQNCFPDDEDDVALIGRKNTELILGDGDAELRCGVRFPSDIYESGWGFNKDCPSFLKLKWKDTTTSSGVKSSATLVGQYINLISPAGSPTIGFADNNNELINDSVINEIIKNAHQLPYGDILCNFLIAFLNAFKNHTHKYHQDTPVQDSYMNALDTGYSVSTLKEQLLSKYVRIT